MLKNSFLVVLVFLAPIILATPIEVKSLEELGYKDFYVNEFNTYYCKEYSLSFQNDVNAFVFPIMQISSEIQGYPNGTEELRIYLNNNLVEELDFFEPVNNKLVYFPKEMWEKNNTLKVCIKTSFNINKIGFLAKTRIGLFESYYFPKEDGFKLELETYEPILGKQFKISAVAKNYGSKDLDVSIYYRKSELEKVLKELSILKGETAKKGVVPKCEKRNENNECIKPGVLKLSYDAVANKAIQMSILPAVMEFTDVFGNKQILLSNRPEVYVKEPQKDIMAEIVMKKDKIPKNQVFEVSVLLKNISEKEINDIKVDLDTPQGKISQNVARISKNEIMEVKYNIKIEEAGNYDLGCEVFYNENKIECKKANLIITNEFVNVETIMGILLGLIGLGVLAYFYFKKESNA
ncbi:MAG: hypothetical protein QXI10_00350 [Candidatus Diapherotrites archaeon]